MNWYSTLVTALAALLSCQRAVDMPHTAESGGTLTVFDATQDAFSLPAAALDPNHRRAFFVGNSFFNQNWVSAPSTLASRDGLGPLFNARSCSTCHFKDGRGRPPEHGQAMNTMLARISLPNQRGPAGEPVGDPTYGDQIQNNALPGVPPEADVIVEYQEIPGRFASGEAFSLRRPLYRLARLGYGAPAPGLLLSPRVAPSMIGLGLLEAVSQATLDALSDAADRNGDGISGRTNQVLDQAQGRLTTGRFGWKAEQPNVRQQIAAAFSGDMGLSSSLFEGQNQTAPEPGAAHLPDGGSPEVSEEVLDAMTLYVRTLAVPARRNHTDPEVMRGEELFATAGCKSCHVPTLAIESPHGLPEIPAQDVHPYTDLLLHDLGEGLTDSRPSFVAEGREWRTPPLWGIGLLARVNGHTLLLHDGRARSFAEAILWHGGEAEAARSRFVHMTRSEREALLKFLESL